ncbi:hypothetical protein DXG01_002390 [Tephrocybe rancida]|nr:hypothetical protein DXG01_002390 [Tephrocybe rancida]
MARSCKAIPHNKPDSSDYKDISDLSDPPTPRPHNKPDSSDYNILSDLVDPPIDYLLSRYRGRAYTQELPDGTSTGLQFASIPQRRPSIEPEKAWKSWVPEPRKPRREPSRDTDQALYIVPDDQGQDSRSAREFEVWKPDRREKAKREEDDLQDETARRKEVAKREETIKQREMQMVRREEVMVKREEEVKRKGEVIRRREEEILKKARELQQKEGELQLREQATTSREAELELLTVKTRESATLLKLRYIFVDVTARHYRRLLTCVGSDAQTILDTFQSLLDTNGFSDRGQLVVAMRRLSVKTHLYPQRYMIDGPVQLIHDYPVDSGKFADIYKADFQGNPTCLKVVRAHSASLVQHMAKVYAREAILWGQLSHPNLLPFYGLHTFRTQIAFVAPWAENGNLSNYLAQEPNANRVLLCADVVAGVEYLHANGVVHGDLKALNILVDRSGRACLSDFGLSGVADNEIRKWSTQSSATSKGGTARWQAPELHDPDIEYIHNTKESDIFAWASTLYEASIPNLLRGIPIDFDAFKETKVTLMILRGDLPSRPAAEDKAWTRRGLTNGLWDLLTECWRTQPSERPDISAIKSRLDNEKPVEDPRPPGQWGLGLAMRFRNAQEASVPNKRPSLRDLDEILSRVMDGPEVVGDVE